MCKVSTQTKDSNVDPERISSLEEHMAALKSFLTDEIYDLKNQIESNNTGNASPIWFFVYGSNSNY